MILKILYIYSMFLYTVCTPYNAYVLLNNKNYEIIFNLNYL